MGNSRFFHGLKDLFYETGKICSLHRGRVGALHPVQCGFHRVPEGFPGRRVHDGNRGPSWKGCGDPLPGSVPCGARINLHNDLFAFFRTYGSSVRPGRGEFPGQSGSVSRCEEEE